MSDIEERVLIPQLADSYDKTASRTETFHSKIPSLEDLNDNDVSSQSKRDLAATVRGGPKKHWKPKKSRKAPTKTWWKFVLRLLFSHVGLFLLVCTYATVGATMFIHIESAHEEQRRNLKDIRALEVNDTVYYLADLFWYWQGQNYTHNDFVSKVQNKIHSFEHYIINSVEEVKYDGEYGTWDYDWTFSKSLLFTVSTITTIGYGHTTPKTQLGMIVVILYAIVGIPLLLLFLANIGDVMANSFKLIYSRMCCRWCRSQRKISEYRKGRDESLVVPRPFQRVADDVVGDEDYMPTSEVNVPILLNLAIIALYIGIGALTFSYWEGWDMVVAAYFTFVTLSTTGYGDYVPGRSFISYGSGFHATARMFFTCFYCAFGMALVSMSITLMQEQIKTKIKWVAREIALTKDDEVET